MIVTIKNAIKVANSLYKKQDLTKNEKVFLNFFSIFNFLAKVGFAFNLKTISMHDIKFLKLIKNFKKIKKLKSGEFYLDSFYYNIFCGDLKNIILSKSGYIKIYENRTYKLLNLLIDGRNIFENSIVINRPNRTIFLNKNFKVNILFNGQKLIINSNKKIDNFNSKYFEILLSTKPNLTFTNAGLTNANLFLLNSCRLSKNASKCKFSVKNDAIYLFFEVNNTQSMQKYINLKQVSLMLNFLETEIEFLPLFLNNFKPNNNKNLSSGNVFKLINGTNKYIKPNSFNIRFLNNVFYASAFLSHATFKLLLMPGEYKVVRTKNGLKIANLNLNFTFYITYNCKLDYVNILNFELIICFSGKIEFTISNFNANFQQVKPYTEIELIKLENIFLENIMLTLFTIQNSFYNQTKIDKTFYTKLKKIIKNKQSIRYSACKLIELVNTVNSSEIKKIYKLNGLLNSLPEKRTNLTDLLSQSQISLSQIDELSLEEQLELYKMKTHKVVEKFIKIC